MAELINEKDSLNTGRKKLNNAIVNADEAKKKSNQAVDVSEQAKQIAQTAKNKADNVQEQFNQVVIEGDSSVEAAQARVDAENNVFATLKERLDTKETQFAAQLAQITLNANNYSTLQEAVNDAVDKNANLLLPDVFEITENIEKLHEVPLVGNGCIKRGNDIFYVTPKESQVNIIYVGAGGNTTNDGLTPDKPITMAKAKTILQGLGDKAIKGQWRIQFVEGVTNERGQVFNNLPYFRKPLQIWGTTDNMGNILSEWDGSDSTSVYAFRSEGTNATLNIEFKNLRFRNWDKHPSNAGALVLFEGVNVTTENVDFINCTIGAWCRGGYSRHYGGLVENCNWGFAGQYNHGGKIGLESNPVTIRNCNIGVFVARQSVMHVDYVNFENNRVDIQLHQKSRVGTIANKHKGWKDVSIWLQGDSIHEDNSDIPSTWDADSITDQTPIYRFSNGSSVPSVQEFGLPYLVAQYSGQNKLTGTTEDTIMSSLNGYGSPLRIPKNWLYSNGRLNIKIRMRVHLEGANGSKTIRLTGAGSSSSMEIANITIPAGGGNGILDIDIQQLPNGSLLSFAEYRSSVSTLNTVTTKSVSSATMDTYLRDKTSDLTLWRLYAKLENPFDSLTLWSLETFLTT